MSEEQVADPWVKALLATLEETVENVHAIYLDPQTSLFDTLATVSAAEASQRISSQCACLAAQTDHVRYFFDVLLGFIQGTPPPDIDWMISWGIESVTEEEWQASLAALRQSYQTVREFIITLDPAQYNDAAIGIMSIMAHTAYHLGEIRQGLGVLRG